MAEYRIDVEKSAQNIMDKIQEKFGVSAERLVKLAEADKEGRVKIYPQSKDKTCGTCTHFKRTPGTRSGKCDIKKWCKNRYGQRIGELEFTPQQSRKACREYDQRGEVEK